MRTLWLFLISLPLLAAEPLVLDASTPIAIVLAAEPSPAAALAAEELQRALNLSLGADATIGGLPSQPVADQVLFHVGPGPGTGEIDVAALGWDHFIIRRHGREIFLVGRDDERDPLNVHFQARTGTLYATYRFLAKVLGMRRLWQGESGEILPQHESITLAELDIADGPALPIRMSYYGYGRYHGGDPLRARVLTARFNGMGASLIGHAGHASKRVMGDRYFATHPEYYALRDGKRQPMAAYNGRGKVCHSNPEVARLFAEYGASQEMTDYFSVSANDSAGWCECAACVALDGPQPADGTPNVSGRMFTFANRVAQETQAMGTEAFPAIYAYAHYLQPPANVQRLEDNLMVYVARGIAWNAHPKTEQNFRRLFHAWGERASRVCLRDYRSNLMPMSLYPYPRRVAADLRFLVDTFEHFQGSSSRGDDTRANALWGPTDYVYAHLLWNPDLPLETILDDYYHTGWPAAHPYVRAYFELFEQRAYQVMAKADQFFMPHKAEHNLLIARELHSPAIMEQGRALLDRAMATAATEDERQRVRFLLDGWEAVTIDRAYYEALMRVAATGEGLLLIPPHPELAGETFTLPEKVRLIEAAYEQMNQRQAFLQAHRDHPGLPTAVLAREDLRYSSSWHRTIRDLYELYTQRDDTTVILSGPWKFRLDPAEEGAAQGWFRTDADLADWQEISTTDVWENQGFGAEEYPATRGYNGWAWYARDLDLPPRQDDTDLILTIGAIDESYDLYLNGERLRSFRYDATVDPDSWHKPQRFRLGDHVKWGETNRLTVAVLDVSGNGGIWKTSYYTLVRGNLLAANAPWAHADGNLQIVQEATSTTPTYRLTVDEIGRLFASHPVQPGERYNVDIQVQCLATEAEHPVSIRASFKDAQGASLPSENHVWLGTHPEQFSDGEWVNLSRSFDVPPGAASMTLTFMWRRGDYLARNARLQQL